MNKWCVFCFSFREFPCVGSAQGCAYNPEQEETLCDFCGENTQFPCQSIGNSLSCPRKSGHTSSTGTGISTDSISLDIFKNV